MIMPYTFGGVDKAGFKLWVYYLLLYAVSSLYSICNINLLSALPYLFLLL